MVAFSVGLGLLFFPDDVVKAKESKVKVTDDKNNFRGILKGILEREVFSSSKPPTAPSPLSCLKKPFRTLLSSTSSQAVAVAIQKGLMWSDTISLPPKENKPEEPVTGESGDCPEN